MKKTIVALSLLLALSFAYRVEACSVIEGFPGEVSDRYDRSDVVFVGKVSSVIQDKSMYGNYRIQFEVSKVYKGDFDHAVVVTANGSSAACGYDDAYGTFKKGTVWAIYADSSLHTSGIVGNTQYDSVAKAVAELDAASEIPTVCTMEYAPVCGRKDTGIRCVTTPCPSYEDKTYGNKCTMRAAGAEFMYEGECRAQEPEVPTESTSKPEPSEPVPSDPDTETPDDASVSPSWPTFLKDTLSRIVDLLVFWK